ncbi:MAG: NAD-dependent epimerase/dehydratase family protein [Candidatus Poribacteria bacterium]|nr:NAD-dependent epimerase/dehydratase family protein [Candidatus Poribacteria bacterium]
MKVLVTGAAGHLGANITRSLVQQGREVRALVRESSPRDLLEPLGVEFAVGDIMDADSLVAAMKGCDVVYHAAAIYRMWSKDSDDIIRPTVEGSRNTLEAARKAGVDKVVYISTVGTVGFVSDPSKCVDESQFNTHSRGAYLRAKCLAERHALEFHLKTGLPIVVVNPGAIIGMHFTHTTPSTDFILDYLTKGAPAVFDTGFSFVDAEDVANGAVLAEERGTPGERYLLGGGNLSLREMYAALSQMTGLPKAGMKVPTPVASLMGMMLDAVSSFTGKPPLVSRELAHDFGGRYMFISSEKAKRELGYRYLEADEAMRRTVEWLVTRDFVPEPRRSSIRLT